MNFKLLLFVALHPVVLAGRTLAIHPIDKPLLDEIGEIVGRTTGVPIASTPTGIEGDGNLSGGLLGILPGVVPHEPLNLVHLGGGLGTVLLCSIDVLAAKLCHLRIIPHGIEDTLVEFNLSSHTLFFLLGLEPYI